MFRKDKNLFWIRFCQRYVLGVAIIWQLSSVRLAFCSMSESSMSIYPHHLMIFLYAFMTKEAVIWLEPVPHAVSDFAISLVTSRYFLPNPTHHIIRLYIHRVTSFIYSGFTGVRITTYKTTIHKNLIKLFHIYKVSIVLLFYMMYSITLSSYLNFAISVYCIKINKLRVFLRTRKPPLSSTIFIFIYRLICSLIFPYCSNSCLHV